MCGRYTLKGKLAILARQMELFGEVPDLPPRYNIAPTQAVPVVRVNPAGKRELRLTRWGLIPHWAKDPTIGNSLINARAETIAQKPAFRDAFKYRRCLIPADGFYEWQKLAHGKKQPHYIARSDDSLFYLAGLWEHWQDEHGNEIETCTIITTEADEPVRSLHDRMPVIVASQDHPLWLDPRVYKVDDLQRLLRPHPHPELTITPVSTRVNKPTHDDPQCLFPM